jgi:hypothetical protein
MKTYLFILSFLFTILTASAGFSPEDIHEVRAYVYDWTQEEKNLTLLKDGKLHKGIINIEGAKLNDEQVKRLLKALDSKAEEEVSADCYMPHHGFVFYDKEGKAIGHIELCFQCGNADSSHEELKEKPWDWGVLRKLLLELEVPILKEDSEYTKLFNEKQKLNKK